jgi:hypothetical protein
LELSSRKITEQMRRRHAERIGADGLQIQVRAEAAGDLLLEPRDLLRAALD